jgi:hypothetical protein
MVFSNSIIPQTGLLCNFCATFLPAVFCDFTLPGPLALGLLGFVAADA